MKVIAAALLIFVSWVGPVYADDILGGGTAVKWKDGMDCGGPNRRCFSFTQNAVGNPITTIDCYRQQVFWARIEEVPTSVASFHDRGMQPSGQLVGFGIRSVLFDLSSNSITITTYLVQDHGGPNNACIGIGGAVNFTLEFD